MNKLGWAVPSSVEVDGWGLVKALSLIFENDIIEEVLKKFENQEIWSWRNLWLKKFEVEEVSS